MKKMIIFMFSLFVMISFSNAQSVNGEEFKKIVSNSPTIVVIRNIAFAHRSYDIYVDNRRIGTIKGEYIKLFGDTFTMRAENGDFILKENQSKRTLRMNFNRLAVITDENDLILGYIGEDKIQDLFKVGFQFHFFNKSEIEIGKSSQVFFESFFKKDIFSNNDGSTAYISNKQFNLLKTYELTVVDKSSIPVPWAIFLISIEDAISK